MKHCQLNLFQQIDVEIHNRESCLMEYLLDLMDEFPIYYYDTGKKRPIPYNRIKDYLQRGIDWMWYLDNNPAEYHRCDFSMLDEAELTYLLLQKPELHYCVYWKNVLSQEKQQLLLSWHPEFTQNVDDLLNLSGEHWAKLLTLHPQYGFLAPWQKLSGDDWQKLLCEQPEFAQYCNFDLLNVENWETLLVNQIRFLSFCPPELRVNFSPEVLDKLFAEYPEIETIW